MSTPPPDPSPRAGGPRPKGWRALVGWLLPFVLAGVAANVHASLHVPRRLPLPQPEKNKRKKPGAKAKPTTRSSTTKAGGKRSTPTMTTPRAERRLEGLWRRYKSRPYGDEPVNTGFDSAHRPLAQRLASQLRERTFRGAPDPATLSVVSSSCKTVRCEIVVHAPNHYEIELFANALHELEGGAQPLLRGVEGVYSEFDHDTNDLTQEQDSMLAARFTIAFTRDLPDIELPGARTSQPLPNAGA